MITRGVDGDDSESRAEQTVAVAKVVGDRFDAGGAGGGCEVEEVAAEADGAVWWCGDVDDAELVAVGVVVVVGDEHAPRRAGIRSGDVVASDWWVVGVAGGEDADDEAALGDVAV